MVTQTGSQTKIIMNQGSYKTKVSRIEKLFNVVLLVNVIIMLVFALALTIANYSFNQVSFDTHSYIFENSSLTKEGTSGAVFFSFYLLLNSYVPLDLVIIVEISKMIYTYFMEQDAQMMRLVSVPLIDQNKSTHSLASLEVHSLNQHEDLALVDYIFADKTGTLTQNELVFRHLSVV